MTGLFDRLAVRATGADRVATPRLSSLFEPHDVTDPESGFVELDSETIAPRPRPAPASSADGPASERRRARPPTDRTHRATQDDRTAPAQPSEFAVERTSVSPTAASDHSVGDSHEQPPPEPNHMDVRTAPSWAQPNHAVHRHEPDEAEHESESTAFARRARDETQSISRDGQLESIEATVRSDRREGWSVDPTQDPPTDELAFDAPTPDSADRTVRVSIGRIDVRSPSPPPATRPRRRRAPAPHISLDQYLHDRT